MPGKVNCRVKAHFNGKQLSVGNVGKSGLVCSWPSSLSKFRNLRLALIYSEYVYSHDASTRAQLEEQRPVGIARFNLALYELYRAFEEANVLRNLHVIVQSTMALDGQQHRKMLSLISMLAGMSKEFSIHAEDWSRTNESSRTVVANLEEGAAKFCKVRSLEQRLKLKAERIAERVHGNSNPSATLADSIQRRHRDALRQCGLIREAHRFGRPYIFVDSNELQEAIHLLESCLDEAEQESSMNKLLV